MRVRPYLAAKNTVLLGLESGPMLKSFRNG